MEEEVCIYFKYGFCWYKETSMKKHLKQSCKDLNNCPNKKICDKRHLKLCRKYVLEGSCLFGRRCDYLHKEKEMLPDQNSLKERVDELEKVVKEKSSNKN